ncbi:hypothetical protein ACFV1U_10560 [Streptomyces microflavus]|uniref:hypothetical protein n=1 Tax=Streptomyces microflavus TaxID=1919 RepID=UPI00368896FA
MPGGLAERTALFRSVAAPLRLLVKVDNVQHAPEARALVPPQGLLVVTGRRALPSLPMDGAVLIDVAPLDEAAGTELVRRWYADADEGTAADAVRLCAGHPLALRAAVEWLAARPQLTLDDVVRDLTAGRYGTGDDGAREAMGVAMGANGEPHRGARRPPLDPVLLGAAVNLWMTDAERAKDLTDGLTLRTCQWQIRVAFTEPSGGLCG